MPSSSPPPPVNPQTQPPDQAHTIRLLAEIIAAGVVTGAVASMVLALLAPFGVGAKAAHLAWRLATGAALRARATGELGTITMPSGIGPAQQAENATAATWRAAYLLAAARRLQAGFTAGADEQQLLATERRYLAAHQAAQGRRAEAARAVDQAAASSGQTGRVLLGWSAEHDDKTTPECAWADGKNFYADTRPIFGWPGAVHMRCRCRPTAPFPGGRLLYAAPTRLLRGH